jgi:hypothetical protein
MMNQAITLVIWLSSSLQKNLIALLNSLSSNTTSNNTLSMQKKKKKNRRNDDQRTSTHQVRPERHGRPKQRNNHAQVTKNSSATKWEGLRSQLHQRMNKRDSPCNI